MKKRVLSGMVFAAIGITILYLNNPIVDSIFIVLIALMSMFEFYKAFKGVGIKPIEWIGYISCLAIILLDKNIDAAYKIMIYKMGISIIIVGLYIYIVTPKLKRDMKDIGITLASIIYIPVLFSFVKLIMGMEHGRIFIWYVIFGAFASDTFAYFIGCKFGKNKLCPSISPKKTVEGAIGGVVGVVIAYVIYTYVLGKFSMPGLNTNIAYWILVAIVASIAGQMGDLTASAIKRYCKIKDFGKIMPGHGGVLDRFDSMMFVAPIVYIFLKLYI